MYHDERQWILNELAAAEALLAEEEAAFDAQLMAKPPIRAVITIATGLG